MEPSKPLSYASSIAVFENLDLITRERILRQVPQLTHLHNLIPYKLNYAELSSSRLSIEERRWEIRPPMNRVPGHPGIFVLSDEENKAVIQFYIRRSQKFDNIAEKTLDGNPVQMLEILIDKYLRNGTIIKEFELFNFPQFWSQKNPQTFQFCIYELTIFDMPQCFERFSSFIESGKLKKLTVKCFSNFPILQSPLVKSCDEICLQFREFNVPPLGKMLTTLKQKTVKIWYPEIEIEKLRELAAYWIKTERPLGDSFYCSIHDIMRMLDVFEDFANQFGAVPSKLTNMGTSYYANCVTIPVNETTEIVVNGAPVDCRESWVFAYIKMEVMPRGSSVPRN